MTSEELTDWLRLEGTTETPRTCTALIPKFNTIGRIDVECGQSERVWVHIVGDRTIWNCAYCNTDHEGTLDDLVEELVR